jgi:HEAT repeat protein/beta-lactamase regulating signal transducer with metallopeptidase domain
MRADLVLLAGSWLFTYVAHSTLLLGGVWLLCRRKVTSPALRESLWKVAMVGGLLTSSLQVGLGLEPLGGAFALEQAATQSGTHEAALPDSAAWGGQLLQSPVSAPRVAHSPGSPLREGTTALTTPVASAHAALESPAVPPTGRSSGLLPVVVGGWAMVAAFLAGLYLFRRARAMREIGLRRPVTEEPLLAMLEALRRSGDVRRRIRITCAQGLGSPVALGSSEIVLPEAALTELDAEQQRCMLAHELAHLARRDPAWLATACMFERVFFLQPLNRVARAGMQEAAELLCDDWAVNRTGSGFSLATCLVKVAEWVDTTPRPVPLAGMAEHRSQLVTRIHRLIEGRTMPTSPRSLWLAAGAVLLLGITAVAAPGVTTSRAPTGDPSGEDPGTAPAITPYDADSMLALEAQPADTDTVASAEPTSRSGLNRLAWQLRALERRVSGTVRARASADMARAEARAEAQAAAIAPRAAWSAAPLPMPRPALAPRPFGIPGGVTIGGRERDTNNIAVPALIIALKDSDVEVRRAAVNSLSNLDDPRAVPGLIDALKDVDAEVRAGAARALGSFEDKRAVPGLVALLKDGNKDVRASALSALHSMPESVPDEAILGAINDGDPDVRVAAIGLALNRMQGSEDDENAKPDPRYVNAFTRLLADASAETRQQAAEALGASHLSEAPAALLAAAKDKNADVRQSAANALGRIGDARSVPTLKEMLQDQSADVRECAVSALGEIRDRTALEALVGALKSSDPAVRRSAAEALGQRGD